MIDLTGVEALAVADKDRGGTLKTMLAYINGMGSGLFSFVMLLTFISLCGWVVVCECYERPGLSVLLDFLHALSLTDDVHSLVPQTHHKHTPALIPTFHLLASHSPICSPVDATNNCFSMGAADRLLAYWMEWVEGEVSSHELAVRTAGANVSVSALSLDHTFYVSIYSGLALLYVLGMLLNAVIFMVGGVRGSKALHFRCLNTLMHAPVSWFNATPSGRIISRFSSDISIVDLYLPRYIDWTSQFGSTVLVVGIVLVLVIPLMLPELLVCFVLFGVLTAASVPLSQGAKRAANTAMSPVQSTLLEIEQGYGNHLACFASQSDDSVPYLYLFSIPNDTSSSFLLLTVHMLSVQGGYSYVRCGSKAFSPLDSCVPWTDCSAPLTLATPS